MAPDHDPPPAYLRRGPLSLSNARERRLGKGGDPREGIQWRRVIPGAIALVTLSAFAAAVWFAYEQGVRRGLQLSPPIIRAETGPVKIPPVAAGGLDVPNQDKEVFDVLVAEEPEARVEQLLPPPDEPLPAPEPEPVVEPPAADLAAAPPLEPADEAEPEPAAESPEQQLAALGPGAEVEPVAEPEPEPVVEPGPPAAELVGAPPIEPEPVVESEPEPEPVVEPEPEPAVAPTPPAEPPIVLTPPPRAAPRPAPEPAIVLTPPPGVEPRAVPEPVEVAALGEPTADMLASFRIQLGSFRKRDSAMVHWATVLSSNRAVLEGLSPLVRTADFGDRGTFYRLQAGPLVSSIVAIALCDVLKTNNVDCLVISP